jgi:hypothetical protein
MIVSVALEPSSDDVEDNFLPNIRLPLSSHKDIVAPDVDFVYPYDLLVCSTNIS